MRAVLKSRRVMIRRVCVRSATLSPLLWLLAQCAALPAQGTKDFADVHGVVRTLDGTPVAGASVSLQSEGGEQARTVQTDTQGNYRFSEIRGGSYTLRVTSGHR